MRGYKILLILLIAMPAWQAGPADGQSLHGLLGTFTRPLRSMLGHFGHFPHRRHHANEANAPANSPEPNDSEFGQAGPLAWPTAYEDLVGYTFWPDDYAPNLRARGFDVIADTMSGRFAPPPRRVQTATTGSTVTDSTTASASGCNDISDTRIEWPVDRIETTVHLSDSQRADLDRLKAAIAQSVKSLKAGCSDAVASAAPDRLNALVQRLWVVRDSGIFIRAPLKTFFDSLTKSQKVAFTRKQPQAQQPAGSNTSKGMRREYQACAAASLAGSERLMKEIEQKVRPDKKQTASLDVLRNASSNMAKLLTASCAQPTPTDPVARLDAADDQLARMNYAATSMQLALADFYAKLDNGQKARFDALSR